MLEFTGTDYIKIDVANNFGHDKLDWQDRIAWVDDNNAQLESMEAQAEAPALFYASVKALRDAQGKRPSGYPISLDATASGMQILAALTGCEKTARHTNLISTGHRENPYGNLYKAMVGMVGGKAVLEYDPTKSAIMKAFYTSKAEPRRVFGEGELLSAFYEVLSTETPGAWALNEAMEAMWDPTTKEYVWTLPDGFTVRSKVMAKEQEWVHFLGKPFQVEYKVNQPTPQGRSLGANMTHSVDGFVAREMNRRCNYNPEVIQRVMNDITAQGQSNSRLKDEQMLKIWNRYTVSGYLSMRILDFVDRQNMGLVDGGAILNMIGTLPKKPFKLLSIHDCFRALPNYANDLRHQYNRIMSEVAASTMLADIVSQIQRKPITVNKLKDISKDILEAEYALS